MSLSDTEVLGMNLCDETDVTYVIRNKFRKTRKRKFNGKYKCYTCNPREYVKKHIAYSTSVVTIHHDMLKRNMLIATPNTHYHTLYEMPGSVLSKMLADIKSFLDMYEIQDYQMITNNGEWQTHHHLHIKIKCGHGDIKRIR